MVAPIHLDVHNGQFLGDVLAMTPISRDLASIFRCTGCMTEATLPEQALAHKLTCPNCGRKTLAHKFRTRANTRHQLVWYGNPYLDQFERDAEIYLRLGTSLGCNASSSSGEHITHAFHRAIEEKTGFILPRGEPIPIIQLAEYEKKLPPIIDGRYWVICIGQRPPFTSKFWPAERWQTVVNSLPEITFVQVGFDDGKEDSLHKHPILEGHNVINLVGKTQDDRSGIRDLFRLVYHADGGCSLVSSLMHILAGFKKPAVVVAGAREPTRFELYPWQRYLYNQGTMKCAGICSDDKHREHSGIRSCWKESRGACPNLESGHPKCIMMIEPEDVTKAVRSYYIGGTLEPVERPAKISTRPPDPIFRLICNARAWGGGERSSVWLANRMLEEGYEVRLVPTGDINGNFMKNLAPHVKLEDNANWHEDPCKIAMVYSNDMVYGFADRFAKLSELKAEKTIMVLNYRIGMAGMLDWTRNCDQYIFLCSELERQFRERVSVFNGVILPPPVDLKPFLREEIESLDRTLHIVRVGSQTAQKMPENIRELVEKVKEVHPAASFTFMGGHDSLKGLPYVTCYKEFTEPVIDIMSRGNAFWYVLKPNYLDNGPRVIMEAMALGIPVVAGRFGGAGNRVTEDTGWLRDSFQEQIQVFAEIDGKALVKKGAAARERAKKEFDPNRWIETICAGL